jgi:competence protein ComEC
MILGNRFVPFLSILISFAGGILIYEYRPGFLSGISYWWFIGGLTPLFCALLFLIRYKRDSSFKAVSAIAIAILGYLFAQNSDVSNKSNVISNAHYEIIKLELEKYNGSSAKFEKWTCSSLATFTNSNWIIHKGKVLLYVPKNEKDLKPGYEVLTNQSLLTVSNSNTGDFDYRKYLLRDNIMFQLFLKEGKYIFIRPSESGLQSLLYKIRFQGLELIREKLGAQSAPVVEAMVLGYRMDLNRYTKELFQSTGSMHVLAVSGLHVGVLFLMLQFFFQLPLMRNIPSLYSGLLILLSLWAYALLTGLSVSVFRSVLMFSLLQIGGLMRRKNSVLNSLAASAFVILFIQPNELFSVGFQFSYLAVAGIVLLYPYLNNLINSRFWILEKAWSMVAVSLSAQLAVGPLSVFYFGSFPTYFFISNFVVIPTGFLILIFGILFLLFGHSGFVHGLLGIVLNKLVEVQLLLLEFISNFNWSVLHVSINEIELVFLYIIILSLCFWLILKQPKYFVQLLIAITCWIWVDVIFYH